MILKCGKCCEEFDGVEEQKELELHHIIPKCIGGTDKDGRKWLCGKCHNIITYSVIIKTMWEFVVDKEGCKTEIKNTTKRWCNDS